jgi:hypothetical protein
MAYAAGRRQARGVDVMVIAQASKEVVAHIKQLEKQ